VKNNASSVGVAAESAASDSPLNYGRVDAIDGLRTVAVMAVIIGHTAGSILYKSAGVGVDIFFTISGFVITGLLLREFDRTRTIRFGLFYANRIARLWPLLFVVSFLVFMADQLFPGSVWHTGKVDALIAITHTMDL
jgi:peptidoglycan/LPS O-acetylase OafA/YrhL